MSTVDQSNKCVAISDTEVEMAPVTTDQFPPLRLLKNKRRIQDDENPSQTHPSVKKVKERNPRNEVPVNNRFTNLDNVEMEEENQNTENT
ncbi:hypothetical protein WA026_019889, partial [Henosepilachna vigintioctopunctata]